MLTSEKELCTQEQPQAHSASFDKTVTSIHCRKKPSLTKGKRMNVGPFFLPYTKIRSKWINDLNSKTQALNFLEIDEIPKVIGIGKNFLNRT